MSFSPEQMQQMAGLLRQVVREELAARLEPARPLLPQDRVRTAAAVKWCGCGSDTSFYRWCAMYGVRPVRQGVYLLAALKRGRAREAAGRVTAKGKAMRAAAGPRLAALNARRKQAA